MCAWHRDLAQEDFVQRLGVPGPEGRGHLLLGHTRSRETTRARVCLFSLPHTTLTELCVGDTHASPTDRPVDFSLSLSLFIFLSLFFFLLAWDGCARFLVRLRLFRFSLSLLFTYSQDDPGSQCSLECGSELYAQTLLLFISFFFLFSLSLREKPRSPLYTVYYNPVGRWFILFSPFRTSSFLLRR